MKTLITNLIRHYNTSSIKILKGDRLNKLKEIEADINERLANVSDVRRILRNVTADSKIVENIYDIVSSHRKNSWSNFFGFDTYGASLVKKFMTERRRFFEKQQNESTKEHKRIYKNSFRK